MKFAVVLKRKTDSKSKGVNTKNTLNETTVEVKGAREVVVRRLDVPTETRLAQERERALNEQKRILAENKKHVLEYERRNAGRPPLMAGNAHLYQRDPRDTYHQWHT